MSIGKTFLTIAVLATCFGLSPAKAAPLPTNIAAMKAMVGDDIMQVRWGYRGGGWGYRGGWGGYRGGWGYRGLGWGAAGAIVGGAIASSAYYGGGSPYYGGYAGYPYSGGYGGGYGGGGYAYCPPYGYSRAYYGW